MITIEKDADAQEIFIHGAPEDIREFAKALWQISEKADTKGKHKQQLSTKSSSYPELSSKLKGEPRKHSIVKRLTIDCRAE